MKIGIRFLDKPLSRSRIGCISCKIRHVKCSEVKPVCGQCNRRKIDCVWPRTLGSRSPHSTEQCEVEIIAPHSMASEKPTSSAMTAYQHSQPIYLPLVEVQSLKLLHHFTTCTYNTICLREGVPEIIQVYTPRLALAYPFLMYTILGLAVLHRYFLDPSLSNNIQASYLYYRNALVSLSLFAPTAGIEEQENAYYIANSFLGVFAFNSFVSIVEGEPTSFAWFTHVRMFINIASANWDNLASGTLKPWFKVDPKRNIQVLPIYSYFPENLFFLMCPSPHIPDFEELLDDTVNDSYKHATLALKESLQLIGHRDYQEIVPFMWPTAVSEEFIQLLDQRRPRALVLLAHYCGLLILIGDRFWWIGSKGQDDLRKIETMLRSVDERWLQWLAWPLGILERHSHPRANIVI